MISVGCSIDKYWPKQLKYLYANNVMVESTKSCTIYNCHCQGHCIRSNFAHYINPQTYGKFNKSYPNYNIT